VSHPYFIKDKLTDAQMRDQVLGAASQITSVTGADPWPWFRFPYGDYNARAISVVNGTGFVPIGWTVDTLGWKGTSGGINAQTVLNRVLGSLRPGEIVLMHCGSHPSDHSTLDANALPAVIQNLQARGYSFVTIDALIGLLQNRIVAKMISTEHPKRSTLGRVLPTSGVGSRPRPSIAPTEGPEPGNLQQPAGRQRCHIDVVICGPQRGGRDADEAGGASGTGGPGGRCHPAAVASWRRSCATASIAPKTTHDHGRSPKCLNVGLRQNGT